MPKIKRAVDYIVKEVMPNVWEICASAVQMHLVVGCTHALLIDTGYGLDDPTPIIKSITDLPLYVLNSHGHIDHAGGNGFFEKAYMHPDDIEPYTRQNGEEMRRGVVETLKFFQKILFFRRIVPKNLDVEKYAKVEFDNFIDIREGFEFDLGGLTAKIIELPGHTKGSVGILIEELRLLYTTDAICPATWLFLPESTKLSEYVKSIEKALSIDFDYFITGHSPKLFPKKDMYDYLAVAKDPDFEHGKKKKATAFSGGRVEVVCYGKEKRKGISLHISEDKL